MTPLKKLILKGTLWTIFGHGVGSVLRLGSNLILTRLLAPDLFGLMTLAGTVLTALHLFLDIGYGPNIAQNKRGDDPEFLNTAWTLQVVRNGIICLFCFLLASPTANFYGQPELAWLIPIMGASTFIEGFQSTSVYTLGRHMDLRRLEIFGLISYLISVVVTIGWAWVSPTVWAFIGGSIVSMLFRLVGSHFLIPGYRNYFAWEKEAVRELFSFGKWIFISTAATFFGMQADRLILGKLVSFELLGVYGIAFGFSELPLQVISPISSKVLLPAIAKISDLPRAELRKTLLRARWFVLVGAAFLLAGLVSFGDVVILTLYDKRYIQAAWILPILALGIWPKLLHESIRQALVAIGKPNYEAWGQILKCFTVVIGVPLGFHFMGLLGAVIVVALNDIPLYSAVSYGLWKQGLNCSKQDIQVTSLLLALIALIVASRWFLGFGFPLSTLSLT